MGLVVLFLTHTQAAFSSDPTQDNKGKENRWVAGKKVTEMFAGAVLSISVFQFPLSCQVTVSSLAISF